MAPWAESRIHLTYRTLEDGQKVVAGIRDAVSRTVIPGTSASISGGLRLYPFERCEAGDKLFGLVKDAGELLGMSIKGQHYDSASEAGFSSSLGVPTICNMGPEGEQRIPCPFFHREAVQAHRPDGAAGFPRFPAGQIKNLPQA